MRMHKKKNLAARMERAASVLMENHKDLRGSWLNAFPGYDKLYIELGCC